MTPDRQDQEDDEIADDLELPPLDADDGDEPDVGDAQDLPGDLPEEGLDDANATDLDVGAELDEMAEESADEREDDVDVGELHEGIDLAEEDPAAIGDDEGEADDEGVDVGEEQNGDDGGAEGTGESPEDEVDERALPDLDDGEEEPSEEAALAETLLGESAQLPWARVRLSPLEGAGAPVPCRSLAVAAGRVAAAGEVLLLVEEGALAPRRLPSTETAVAVTLAEDAILAATARGRLLAVRGDALEAVALGSARGTPITLATTPGRFWIHAGGALSSATLPAAALTTVRERGVLAIAAAGGALCAITTGASGPVIERFRGDDEGGTESPLTGIARAIAEEGRDALQLAAATGGRCLALGDGRRLAVSRDGGATFTSLDPGPIVAFTFRGDDVDAPLLVLLSGPASHLVQIDASGEAERVAELPAAETQAAIAWDATREVVWIAGGAGLVALGVPHRH